MSDELQLSDWEEKALSRAERQRELRENKTVVRGRNAKSASTELATDEASESLAKPDAEES